MKAGGTSSISRTGMSNSATEFSLTRYIVKSSAQRLNDARFSVLDSTGPLPQRIKYRLGINAEQKRSRDHRDDCEASERANDNFVGRRRSHIPVNRAHHFEVIVEAGADRDHGDDNEAKMLSRNGGVENKKLAEKTGGERHTCERSHGHQHGEGEKW